MELREISYFRLFFFGKFGWLEREGGDREYVYFFVYMWVFVRVYACVCVYVC